MSWITDLAGKAENLLNQIDQGAGEAIVKVKESKQHGTPGRKSRAGSEYQGRSGRDSESHDRDELLSVVSEPAVKSNYTGANVTSLGNTREHMRSSGYASSMSSYVSHNKQPNEEKDLMAYLNQDGEAKAAGTSVGTRSRRSSTSSMHSIPAQLFALAKSAAAGGTASVSETMAVQMEVEPVSTQSEYTISTTAERKLTELQAREKDMNKAVQAKDAQLAVLRVQLQETQQELKSKTIKLEKTTQEQERLLRDSSDSSKVRNQALDSLKKQLDEATNSLDRERTQAVREQTELLAKIERLEDDLMNLNKQLTDVQKAGTDDKLRNKEMDSQLRLAKYNLEANKNEFDEYKQKAQKILQSKEKIIESLKSGSSSLADVDHTQLAIQLEEVTAERDLLKEDLQQLHIQLENMKSELQEVESQMANEQRESLEQQRSLHEQCQTYQMNAAQFREQLEQLKAEYQYVQDELRRQHLEVQDKLHEKDTEIARLLSQSSQRSTSKYETSELEQRVKSLTENLIHKQTIIETLQTDKNSLSLQMERVNALYEEAQSAAIRAIGGNNGSNFVGLDEAQSASSSRIPIILRSTPYDSTVTRAVKVGYAQLDLFSAKVAVTFRRYPFARVLMLFYMLLLHLWVMVVLLTYTPEIHTGIHSIGADGHGAASGVAPAGAHPMPMSPDK